MFDHSCLIRLLSFAPTGLQRRQQSSSKTCWAPQRGMCATESVFHLPCSHWGRDRFAGEPCVRAPLVTTRSPFSVAMAPSLSSASQLSLCRYTSRSSSIDSLALAHHGETEGSRKNGALAFTPASNAACPAELAAALAATTIEKKEMKIYLPCLYVEQIGMANSNELCPRCLTWEQRARTMERRDSGISMSSHAFSIDEMDVNGQM